MIKKVSFLAFLFWGFYACAQTLLPQDYIIAHAGGGIDGQTYLNCLEGIENALKHQVKYIEIDLAETSDGHIVAVHDWHHFNGMTEGEDSSALTLKDFKKRKILNKYTPVSVDDIKMLMLENENWILIADKIENYGKLLEQLPFPKRIMVETISFKNYHEALASGIVYPVFSKRLSEDSDIDLLHKELKENHVQIMTVGEGFYFKNKEFLRLLRKEGMKIILFSPQVISDSDMVKKEAGVYFDLIYSDFCFPDKPCE